MTHHFLTLDEEDERLVRCAGCHLQTPYPEDFEGEECPASALFEEKK